MSQNTLKQTRRKWLGPALIAVILSAGNLASELFGDLIGAIPEAYKWIVWSIIAISSVTAIIVAVFEKRQQDGAQDRNTNHENSIAIKSTAKGYSSLVGQKNIGGR